MHSGAHKSAATLGFSWATCAEEWMGTHSSVPITLVHKTLVPQGNTKHGEVSGWQGGLFQQLCVYLLRMKNDQDRVRGIGFPAFPFSGKGQEVNLPLQNLNSPYPHQENSKTSGISMLWQRSSPRSSCLSSQSSATAVKHITIRHLPTPHTAVSTERAVSVFHLTTQSALPT